MFLACATLGVQFLATEPGLPSSTFLAMAQISALAAVGGFVRRLPFRVRGVLLIVALVVFGAVGTHDFGPRPAVVLAFETASLLAALLYGGRAGVGVQALGALCLF